MLCASWVQLIVAWSASWTRRVGGAISCHDINRSELMDGWELIAARSRVEPHTNELIYVFVGTVATIIQGMLEGHTFDVFWPFVFEEIHLHNTPVSLNGSLPLSLSYCMQYIERLYDSTNIQLDIVVVKNVILAFACIKADLWGNEFTLFCLELIYDETQRNIW